VLSRQLELLQELKRLPFTAGQHKEKEWAQFTGNVIMRSFGSDNPNVGHFQSAKSAGEYFVAAFGYEDYSGLDQSNYEARIQAFEGVLKSCLAELKLDLPEPEIKGVFEPGQEYEFYRAVKTILGLATKEIFVIDPYISSELFETYADAIPRTVSFRLLSVSPQQPVLSLAQKYASGGNFQMRSSNAIHDRVLFSDARVWLCGQSLKDAAKRKPTYIVEHDEPLMRPVYETLWGKATVVF
jgi:hypothetical protein